MKKHRFTLLIVSLAAIMGFSDSAWGQGIIIDPTYNNVNNDFGAGESATISGNNLTVPNTLTIANGTSGKITIGGVNAVNQVIRVYNGDGYGIGWVSVVRQPASGSYSHYADPPGRFTYAPLYDDLFLPNASDPSNVYTRGNDVVFATSVAPATGYTAMPAIYLGQGTGVLPNATYPKGTGARYQDVIVMSFNSFNDAQFSGQWTGTYAAPCNLALFSSSITGLSTDGSATIQVSHHQEPNMLRYYCAAITAPGQSYTTTMNATFSHTPGYHPQTDFNVDEVNLTQFKGKAMQDAEALNNQRMPLSVAGLSSSNDNASTWYIDNYTRPTTVAIASGITELDTIDFRQINWQYEVNYVKAGEIASYTGMTRNNTECNSGQFRAYAFEVEWDPTIGNGNTHPDAAVQLLAGARVCVTKDVKDNTGYISKSASVDKAAASPNTNTQTNALIVFPVADRVTMRTAGDFQANMHHESASAFQSTNAFYTTTNFPDPDKNIYLYPRSSSAAHQFAMPGNLDEFQNSAITSHVIDAPTDRANSSIFGVYGDYDFDGLMAEINTTAIGTPAAPGGTGNNPGVIEIGPKTDGKDHFHIYSGGILKNFEGCTTLANFTMSFGTLFGGMPELVLDDVDPLYILNYGNNNTAGCAANILFLAGAEVAIKDAFENASNEGALQIQALSDVTFDTPIEIDATSFGNNLYVLSDAGNVITNKTFDITSDYIGTTGKGMITFWAEDRGPGSMDFATCANTDPNRNGVRGNLFLNDDVSVTRTEDSDGDTETNLIAANNIRTADFTFESDNENSDFTNVISRKGDIYLGYSKGNDKKFTYAINEMDNAGVLNIKAGYDDQANNTQLGGGNIYFTQIEATMAKGGIYPTNIMIPFSNEYFCKSGWTMGTLHERSTGNNSMQLYEHAGIIGGIGQCGIDSDWSHYAGVLTDALTAQVTTTAPSLKYTANDGALLIDAGSRGNIIMNQGSELDFQGDDGEGFFRTRKGDIDMRGQTNVEGLAAGKGLVFLADNGTADKSQIVDCECDEEFNNVYMQDFDFATFVSPTNNGSVYFGADNNIKLQYGGLRNIGTWKDPFLRADQSKGYPCGSSFYHCDSDPSVNKARPMILDYTGKTTGGVGVVASDMIDVYKQMIYTGGSTAGMAAVPGKTSANGVTSPAGSLHGENVAGYGLYVKTQANKKNWSVNPFTVTDFCKPPCFDDLCGSAVLHRVARVTFHDDARIIAENSKAYIGSPVLEVYGHFELNTTSGSAKTNQLLHIQTDSLILHDSLILDGNNWRLSTWSNLYRGVPVIKLGHQRLTPPVDEELCKLCFSHVKGGDINKRTALDTMVVTYRNNAELPRLHTLVADHTVLTFLADNYDGNVPKLPPVFDARIFTDTFKIRNQVELWSSADKTHEGHFELVSEIQMSTKDYAGVYSRHLHMEPIAPDCSKSKYSELWTANDLLDVVSTSTFGGFGTVHADVYAETIARIAPGYASLGEKGNCYEHQAGTLKMQNLRMDKGAEIYYSIGDKQGLDGELADCIVVDHLLLRGDIHIYVEKRCNQRYIPGCYPIIRYNSVDDQALNNLKLATTKIDGTELRLDFSEPGVVNLCIAETTPPVVRREVILPQPPHGVTIFPNPGVHYVLWGNDFRFTLNYFGREEYEVYTDRTSSLVRGVEVLTGTMNANGEHEYVLRNVTTQPIRIYIGPNTVGNESLDGAAVWSSGNTLYIRVSREDIASIYSIAGTLVHRIEVPEGGITLPLSKGAYVVTLKDGSVHKVIIR